ncbi:MAG: hypothetical protein ACRDTT_02370 [Pseudonocardiaceae bacterium]
MVGAGPVGRWPVDPPAAWTPRIRLSGVVLAYPPPADGNPLAGRRMPDLVPADAPVSSVFLHAQAAGLLATDFFTSIPSRCADSISFSRNFTAAFDAV